MRGRALVSMPPFVASKLPLGIILCSQNLGRVLSRQFIHRLLPCMEVKLDYWRHKRKFVLWIWDYTIPAILPPNFLAPAPNKAPKIPPRTKTIKKIKKILRKLPTALAYINLRTSVPRKQIEENSGPRTPENKKKPKP